MNVTREQHAARNNAAWCDAVCRAHGLACEMDDVLWRCRGRVPRFYSNLVAIAPGTGAAVLRCVDELTAAGIDAFSVKDSFLDVDLSRRGFRLLFQANWIWRDPAPPANDVKVDDVCWTLVRDERGLEEWERAWDDGGTTPRPRQFPPSLLADPRIAFVAGRRHSRVVAGAIANRTGDVVGLSNTFSPPGDDATPYWAGFMAAMAGAFPGRPVVGYERGDDLAVARAIGFEVLDPLRVWIRDRLPE